MKNIRQSKILEIIKTQDIFNQHDLLVALNSIGFNAAQPTISRDIKELGLIKVQNENGAYKYATPKIGNEASKHNSFFFDAILNVSTAGNLVVIKCKTGMAQAACASIDEMALELIVGTIAGDDTIFVATASEANAKLLTERLFKEL